MREAFKFYLNQEKENDEANADQTTMAGITAGN